MLLLQSQLLFRTAVNNAEKVKAGSSISITSRREADSYPWTKFPLDISPTLIGYGRS